MGGLIMRARLWWQLRQKRRKLDSTRERLSVAMATWQKDLAKEKRSRKAARMAAEFARYQKAGD